MGCDEAGRGCLAGAVYAAAVILPPNFDSPRLNDSKKLTEKVRNELRIQIEAECDWAVGIVSPAEIDEINILWASFLAMHRAIAQLKTTPEHILVDGNRFKPYAEIPYTCIVKGDGKYLSIAAASVLAKTHRDAHMLELSKQHKEYGWEQNKGYPTKQHRLALQQFGATSYHRKSFNLIPAQLTLDLKEK